MYAAAANFFTLGRNQKYRGAPSKNNNNNASGAILERQYKKKSFTMTAANTGNVRVVARIRPLSRTEIEKNSEEAISSLSTLERSFSDFQTVSNDPEVLQVHVPDGDKRWFELDAVFDKNSSQEEVYVRSGAKNAVINDIFKGFNCTVLAYGQVSTFCWLISLSLSKKSRRCFLNSPL